MRYIYSRKCGWIDLQHVVTSYTIPIFQGFSTGWLMENWQILKGGAARQSAFLMEDIISNALGSAAAGMSGTNIYPLLTMPEDPGRDISETITSFCHPLLTKKEAIEELRPK